MTKNYLNMNKLNKYNWVSILKIEINQIINIYKDLINKNGLVVYFI